MSDDRVRGSSECQHSVKQCYFLNRWSHEILKAAKCNNIILTEWCCPEEVANHSTVFQSRSLPLLCKCTISTELNWPSHLSARTTTSPFFQQTTGDALWYLLHQTTTQQWPHFSATTTPTKSWRATPLPATRRRSDCLQQLEKEKAIDRRTYYRL